ncbi:MAG: ABC transporter ATP-binding protein [Planctomycetota bacterium]|nr:ABC transporter ATP-binding protein [Planctomycetota bacterium]
MIETHNLTKTYKNLVAVRNLNLQIDKGDVYGFIGPNGAGKTTTIKMLATLLKPTRGTATVCGFNIVGQSMAIRHRIGYMPDFFGVYDDMRVHEYLEFFAAAYRIRGPARKKIVDDVLELTDLRGKKQQLIQGLSRGMQQRLGLARVLLHDPEVLLLDEPASGLDPRARIEVRELLKELRNMGKTILISSHILSELAELCNKIGIIEKGELLYSGSLEDVMKEAGSSEVVILGVQGDGKAAGELLRSSPHIETIDVDEKGEIRLTLKEDAPTIGFISELLVKGGFPIVRMEQEQPDLEEVFMRVTKGIVS